MNTYKPCIVVLAGIPVAGKTTLGRAICEGSNFFFCDVETARKQIEGSGAWLGPEKEKDIMLSAYTLNHRWVEEKVRDGRPVLITATYSRPVYHEMLAALQQETGVPLKVFLLTAPQEVVMERIAERSKNNPSNLRTVEQLQTVLDRYVPYPDVLETIDTTRPMEECVNEILKHLTDLRTDH